MKKDIRIIFVVCLCAIAVVLLFQLFWLRNYYQVNNDRFEKEVNLAFEDAIKKEFQVRNDTLEKLLFAYLLNPAQARIKSTQDKSGKFIHHISDVRDTLDRYSFSHPDINFPIISETDSNKVKVAKYAATLYREEDLERHIIFYKTQDIGKYISIKADEFSFDTSRLRRIFRETLAQREIYERFVFYLKDEDNTLNRNPLSDSVSANFAVVTKAYPTYKYKHGQNFVRAMFYKPDNYLFTKSKYLLLGSIISIIIVAVSFYYLLKIIRKQKRLSDIKNDFINNITHEFKTPIATVYSAVEALDDFEVIKDPVKTKRYLGISKNELERLSALVTRILNISLHENLQQDLKNEVIDIDATIRHIMELYRDTSQKEIRFTYNNESINPLVRGDKAHIYNSINNIMDNAIKYSMEMAEINITLSDKGQYLVINIEDKGIGIHKRDLLYIFDKFYRVSSAVKGYGLGLAYTKSIIEKHKGWCSAESVFGKGSKFYIGLPSLHE